MHTVNVVLDKQLSTPLNPPNKIRVTSITRAITLAAEVIGAQYRRNLDTHIAVALGRDPGMLITNVSHKSNIQDVVSVRILEVDLNKSDSTTTRYRMSAYYVFDVYHQFNSVSDAPNESSTLDAMVW